MPPRWGSIQFRFFTQGSRLGLLICRPYGALFGAFFIDSHQAPMVIGVKFTGFVGRAVFIFELWLGD